MDKIIVCFKKVFMFILQLLNDFGQELMVVGCGVRRKEVFWGFRVFVFGEMFVFNIKFWDVFLFGEQNINIDLFRICEDI